MLIRILNIQKLNFFQGRLRSRALQTGQVFRCFRNSENHLPETEISAMIRKDHDDVPAIACWFKEEGNSSMCQGKK